MKRTISLLLAGLLLLGALASCGKPTENGEETEAPTRSEPSAGETAAVTEADTGDNVEEALEALGEIDFDDRNFTILYSKSFKKEIVGVNGSIEGVGGVSQVVNDAVYKRNSLLEDLCHMTIAYIERDTSGVNTLVSNEASAGTGEFQLIDNNLGEVATNLVPNNFLYNIYDLGISPTGAWWDDGTADFVIKGGLYFMSGSFNICDDGVTYALLFNKDMQKTYAKTVPNPYDTVRNWEWTLDYFHNVIQGVARENGDGKWDEQDTYGFTTTWEYGNIFFLGSDVRYVLNDETVEKPSLYLADQSHMERALNVLELSKDIYHDGATYMSPPGQEGKGLSAFRESRSLFYGEIVDQLENLNKSMDGEYGVLPVPKYDKAQEFYRAYSHGRASTFALPVTLDKEDLETVGKIFEAYAILSHQYLKPAYYDTVLTSRQLKDPDSAEMMDIIFAHRVCDMGFYFTQLGFNEIFRDCVNANGDSFSSSYAAKAKNFDRLMERIFIKLDDHT